MIDVSVIPREWDVFDFRRNLIVDPNNPILVQKAWRDRYSGPHHWRSGGPGGHAYLGVAHGEDALTWNVFRSLQVAGDAGLDLIAALLSLSRIKSILFWGCDVDGQGDLQQLVNIAIRTIDGRLEGTMTEPDLVILTDEEIAFIECKVNITGEGSPWKAHDETRSGKRLRSYADDAGFSELLEIRDWAPVYQIIRQYVFACCLGNILGVQPTVIPLINAEHASILEPLYGHLREEMGDRAHVFRNVVTWQDVLAKLEMSQVDCQQRISDKLRAALAASSRRSTRR